jgi:pimeloyl-ACP methyl ester carboxylesterase
VPRLVLIHGLVMDSHASFYLSIAPALARHAGVLLYDLRGHGRSEQPPTGYTMADMVADLWGVLDGSGLAATPVVLVGNSYGGQIAMRAASERPERVRALVLIDPQSGIPDFTKELADILAVEPEERDRRAYELFARWLAEHAAAREPAAPDAQAEVRRSETIDDVMRHRKQRRSPGVRTAVGLAGDTTLVADLARETPISDAEVARIRCPVLAVYGERSELRQDEERFRRLLPQLEVAVVPGMGHTVLLEAPNPLRDAILAWLARQPA